MTMMINKALRELFDHGRRGLDVPVPEALPRRGGADAQGRGQGR
jgi:hypothetical protein